MPQSFRDRLFSSFFFLLAVVAVSATSISSFGAESESTTFSTAVDLVKKTEAFWNGIQSIDMTYSSEAPRFEDDKVIIETLEHRWMFDRASRKQRYITDDPIDEGRIYHNDCYFDGTNTYQVSGRDVVTPFKSELEYQLKLVKEGIMRYANRFENDDQARATFNTPYQYWFPEGRNSFFSFGLDADRELSVSEAIARCPSSKPQRTVDASGDVLWTFRQWPTQENAERFPVGKDVVQKNKEDFKQAEVDLFRDVTINESKNFLLQSARTVSFAPRVSGGIAILRTEYETLSYVQAGGFYFPEYTEIRSITEGYPPMYNKHKVKKIQIDGKLDFDSFKIPEFTNGNWIWPNGEQKAIVWGKNNEIELVMTVAEADERILNMLKEQYEESKRGKESQNEERLGVRLVLCALGTGLIIFSVWLKRRRKTNQSASGAQS